MATQLGRARVSADPLRLGQVLTNLLTNAVNYNQEGGEVTVRVETTDRQAIVSVRDTGCGIPEEDRPHLFERFYRVDKARARASGGNGLGLAICKSIVDAHGGTLGFETQLGRGTTFWIRLPALSAELTEAIVVRAKR
jgi:signal transduction histidine kinase